MDSIFGIKTDVAIDCFYLSNKTRIELLAEHEGKKYNPVYMMPVLPASICKALGIFHWAEEIAQL